MNTLLYFETSGAASPNSQRNTSEDLNAQQQFGENVTNGSAEILCFGLRSAIFGLCAFEGRLLTALKKDIYHQSRRFDVSPCHFILSRQQNMRFASNRFQLDSSLTNCSNKND
jgi:hypothetical protein